MIDINELRQLAQAATPGPDGISLSWVRLLRDFQQGASPAAITEILDRLEAAEKECDALRADKATLQQMMYSLKDRLEAAEKSDAESLAMYRKARDERDALRAAVRHEADCVEACKSEIDALRAKIEAMERQEPVGVLHVGSCYGEELEDWEFEADQRVCDRLNERHVTNPTSLKLYALPGAQPAPSVPTALLVAVADLVAQMEIVSRVGFIDTPDDKDSCAAFCVAEGTWLELMSAIESLASALAAAPEAKP